MTYSTGKMVILGKLVHSVSINLVLSTIRLLTEVIYSLPKSSCDA